MGLVIEFFGMVEDVGVDSRNAFTLIAVNQNVLITPVLPFIGPRHFVTFGYDYEGDDLAEDANIEVDFQIVSPSGGNLLGQHNVATAPKKSPDSRIPGNGMSLIMALNLYLPDYGEYCARLALKVREKELGAERRFWVVSPLSEAASK
jgi:hypothetical protein